MRAPPVVLCESALYGVRELSLSDLERGGGIYGLDRGSHIEVRLLLDQAVSCNPWENVVEWADVVSGAYPENGFDLLGAWHSEPVLGVPVPSARDRSAWQRMARAHDRPELLALIVRPERIDEMVGPLFGGGRWGAWWIGKTGDIRRAPLVRERETVMP